MLVDDEIRERYPFIARDAPTFYFIGVTTGKSRIMTLFPSWVAALGHPEVVIEGIDLHRHDDPERYRQAVARIKYDPLCIGGLVTAHKIDLVDAARDMFDYLDSYALLCGEVCSLSKRDGALEGYAQDPITSGLSLDAVLGRHYFERTGGDVLCFGAGGSAVAIALHLIQQQEPGDRPRHFIAVNRSPERLARMRQMVDGLGTDIGFEYLCSQDPRRNDELLAQLPAGSLVINATGMGKDTPGSPITAAGLFPHHAVAWELNYRGELDFLHQAVAQRESRHVQVEDGWLYFLHGWTQAIAQAFHLEMYRPTFERLAMMADRPR